MLKFPTNDAQVKFCYRLWIHSFLVLKFLIHSSKISPAGPETTSVTHSLLDSLNIEQGREENKANLEQLGGIEKLISMIGVDPHNGWTQAQVLSQREKFGDNTCV